MSAQDPIGGQKFWFNGLPYSGIAISSRSIGAQQYWFNGLPVQTLFPTTFIPPINPGNSANGKKGGAPGQLKKQEMILAGIVHRRKRRLQHVYEASSSAYIPAQYLSPNDSKIRSSSGLASVNQRKAILRINISPSGHTVRKD